MDKHADSDFLASSTETRTIDRVPEHERHGSPTNQMTLWFAANMQFTAVVDGALAIIFGAEVLTAILGLLLENVLGGALMALHSTAAPQPTISTGVTAMSLAVLNLLGH